MKKKIQKQSSIWRICDDFCKRFNQFEFVKCENHDHNDFSNVKISECENRDYNDFLNFMNETYIHKFKISVAKHIKKIILKNFDVKKNACKIVKIQICKQCESNFVEQIRNIKSIISRNEQFRFAINKIHNSNIA